MHAFMLLGAWLFMSPGALGTPDAPAPAKAPGDVQAFLDTLMAADTRGDLETVAAAYAEDAVLMPPSGPPVLGRTAIRERYRQIFAGASLEVSLVAEEAHDFGDWAAVRGRTTGQLVPRLGLPIRPVRDKFLMLLQRDAARAWRIHTLMWSPIDATSP